MDKATGQQAYHGAVWPRLCWWERLFGNSLRLLLFAAFQVLAWLKEIPDDEYSRGVCGCYVCGRWATWSRDGWTSGLQSNPFQEYCRQHRLSEEGFDGTEYVTLQWFPFATSWELRRLRKRGFELGWFVEDGSGFSMTKEHPYVGWRSAARAESEAKAGRGAGQG